MVVKELMKSRPEGLPSAEIRTCGLEQEVILATALGRARLFDAIPLNASNRYPQLQLLFEINLRRLLGLYWGISWVERRASQWWAVERVIQSTAWGSSLLLPTTTTTTTTATTTTFQGESAPYNSGEAKVLTVESGIFSALIPRIAVLLILLLVPWRKW